MWIKVFTLNCEKYDKAEKVHGKKLRWNCKNRVKTANLTKLPKCKNLETKYLFKFITVIENIPLLL